MLVFLFVCGDSRVMIEKVVFENSSNCSMDLLVALRFLRLAACSYINK